MNSLSVFEEAQRRIAEKNYDEKDEVLVALWKRLEEVVLENRRLRKGLDNAQIIVQELTFLDATEKAVSSTSPEALTAQVGGVLDRYRLQ